jgi:hypothetical protein
MKLNFYILLLFCSFLSFAQTKFEPGSYIDLNNTKHEGFIKNLDWKSNPSQIIFKSKITDSEDISVNTINIKEFEIYGISKYIKFNVNIDISSTNIADINYTKEPIFENKEFLLKVLLEGKKSLYYLSYNLNGKYFFNNSSGEIEELIYKKYKVNPEEAAKMRESGDKVYSYSTILTNNGYIRQLFTDINCNVTRERVKKVVYNQSSLLKYFKEYNKCENTEFKTYNATKNAEFKLNALIAINNNSIDLSNKNNTLYSNKFENKTSIGAGFELEVIFPYNNNKWAFFTETSFNTYKDDAILKDEKGFSLYDKQKVNIQYNYIQISPGFRHYFYLNENSKINLDVIYNIKKGIGNNNVDYEREQDLAISNDMLYNFALGASFNYKKYSLGIRAYNKSNVLEFTSDSRYAKYSNLSFMFKYTVL